MDAQSGRGSSGPLQSVSPERINQQQGSTLSFGGSVASVTDKISQFNSLATQSKHLERKTADAALKRAMVGREEAEAEMRRYREEARQLRKQLDEGRERERRVGERLEHVMALWEKEIRRARKETFKSQSAIVKLQEELKAARASTKATEEALSYEKERSKNREQEAFQARYELVGCQEELEQTLQKVKMLEQERDAFRSLAKSEEDVARIASEGRLPLPPSEDDELLQEDDAEADKDKDAEAKTNTDKNDADKMDETEDNNSASESEGEQVLTVPKQRTNKNKGRRVSSLHDIKSSAASEAEIEELTRLWQWEKQRADRSSELVEYLEAECHLRACSCMKKRPRTGILESARKRPALDIGDGGDRIILSEKAALASPTAKIRASLSPKKLPASDLGKAVDGTPSQEQQQEQQKEQQKEQQPEQQQEQQHACNSPQQPPKKKASRLSTTVFVPEEGIFRTVSQQLAEEMEEAVSAAADATIAAMPKEPTVPKTEEAIATEPAVAHVAPAEDKTAPPPPAAAPSQDPDVTASSVATEQPMYARTPSVDPPAYAQTRTSLLSLLDAPHRQEAEQPINFYVPTTPGPVPAPTPTPTESQTKPAENSSNNTEMAVDTTSKEEADTSLTEQPIRRAAASILVSSTHNMDDTEMGDEVDDDGEITVEIEQSRVSDVTDVYSRSTRQEYAWYGQEQQKEEPQQQQQQQQPKKQQPEQPEHTVETKASHNESRPGRPHTVTGNVFSTKTRTTTTKVPLREETTDPSLAQRIMAAQRTPQHRTFSASAGSDDSSAISDGPSFDINNPALTPTMTREECLAQIKERRVRARSAAGGSTSSSGSRSGSVSGPTSSAGVTKPGSGGTRRPVTPGRERRDISAPMRRVTSGRRGRM